MRGLATISLEASQHVIGAGPDSMCKNLFESADIHKGLTWDLICLSSHVWRSLVVVDAQKDAWIVRRVSTWEADGAASGFRPTTGNPDLCAFHIDYCISQ
jgi:hypothetical protein